MTNTKELEQRLEEANTFLVKVVEQRKQLEQTEQQVVGRIQTYRELIGEANEESAKATAPTPKRGQKK